MNRNSWLYIAIIVLLGLGNIFQLLRASRTDTPSPRQTITPTAASPGNNTGSALDVYQIIDYPSPDKKWNVQIEFVRNFQNKCFAQIELQNNKGEPLGYMQNDGWRGYDIACSFDDNPEDGIVGYTSTFSGWSPDSRSFTMGSDYPPYTTYNVTYDGVYWKLSPQ